MLVPPDSPSYLMRETASDHLPRREYLKKGAAVGAGVTGLGTAEASLPLPSEDASEVVEAEDVRPIVLVIPLDQLRYDAFSFHGNRLIDTPNINRTANHGEHMRGHKLLGKGQFFEEAFRVPLIFRYPGVIPAGQRFEAPASGVDVAPTILDYCEAESPSIISWREFPGHYRKGRAAIFFCVRRVSRGPALPAVSAVEGLNIRELAR